MTWFNKKYHFLLHFFSTHEKTFFLILSTWLCLEYFILGPYSYVRHGDNIDSVVPRAINVWNFISLEHTSYWYNLLAGGVDRLANEISAARLDSLFFFLFPDWIAYAGVLFLGTFVGGYFMYLLCKQTLKLNTRASFFAGIFFANSLLAIDILPMVMGLAALPFVLYCLERLLNHQMRPLQKRVFSSHGRQSTPLSLLFSRVRGARLPIQRKSITFSEVSIGNKLLQLCAVAILGILFGFSSSLLLTLPFTLGGVIFWFWIIRRRIDTRTIVFLAIFAASSFLTNIQEMQSLLANVHLSQRSGGYYNNVGFLHYLSWVGALLKQNGGVLIVMLAGFFLQSNLAVLRRLYILSGILLFVASAYLPVAKFFRHTLGFLSDFGFDRFDLLVPFFAVIASAYVLTETKHIISFTSLPNRLQRNYSVGSLLIGIMLFHLFFINVSTKINHGEAWLKTGSFFSNTYSPDLESLVKMNEDSEPFRVATITERSTELVPTLAHFFGLETIDGHTNLVNRYYIDFFRLLAKNSSIKSSLYLLWDSSNEARERFFSEPSSAINLELLAFANVKYVVSPQPLFHSRLKLVPTASSQKEYLAWDDLGLKEKLMFRLNENFTGKKLFVYENLDMIPRYFLVNKIRVFNSEIAMLESLASAKTTELQEEVYVRSTDASHLTQPTIEQPYGQAVLETYTQDKMELTTTTKTPSTLVITNNYHPDWKATINNKTEKIVPAYHTFMAIPIPAGTNRVLLQYKPSYASEL
jgi:hypothetical protein